jgi:hypothetical protein
MTNGDEPERLLTIAQAAEMANYDESTILDWIARGLPHVAPCGRVRPRHADIRIKSSELWAWIDGLRREIRPKAGGPKASRKVGPATARPGGLSAWRRGEGVK